MSIDSARFLIHEATALMQNDSFHYFRNEERRLEGRASRARENNSWMRVLDIRDNNFDDADIRINYNASNQLESIHYKIDNDEIWVNFNNQSVSVIDDIQDGLLFIGPESYSFDDIGLNTHFDYIGLLQQAAEEEKKFL